jgi:uncharacterized protein
MEVDQARKRIALSLRLDDPLEPEEGSGAQKQSKPNTRPAAPRKPSNNQRSNNNSRPEKSSTSNEPVNNAFAEAFANAKKGK